jgi:hypothetical protein
MQKLVINKVNNCAGLPRVKNLFSFYDSFANKQCFCGIIKRKGKKNTPETHFFEFLDNGRCLFWRLNLNILPMNQSVLPLLNNPPA